VIFWSFGRLGRWSLMFALARLIVREGRKRWGNLRADERSELSRLVKTSKGRQSRLSPAEQEELGRLVRKASGRPPATA
jgi:hypothetical protein